MPAGAGIRIGQHLRYGRPLNQVQLSILTARQDGDTIKPVDGTSRSGELASSASG